jgi:threonine/homoserine/homoserine lactone efflux protein
VAAIGHPRGGSRQGFRFQLTNPQMLVFYPAVLPQFLLPGSARGRVLAAA